MVNTMYPDGMYTHKKLPDAYIKIHSVEAAVEVDALEIVFDLCNAQNDIVIEKSKRMFVKIDDLFDWSQRGLC